MQESFGSRRDRAVGSRLLTGFVFSEFCIIVGNLAVRLCTREALVPTWAIALIAIATACPMLIFAAKFFRLLNGDLDEMLQRVLLEGIAFGMIVFVPIAGLYVNLRTAGLISIQFDPPELMLLPSILIALGVAISWRRFK